MMTLRQRSVNVNRLELIEALKKNLETHRAEYEVALADFKTRLLEDLKTAQKHVNKTEAADLKNFSIHFSFPQNHEKDFVEVIEMLEMSVDENINLDADSFRAYIKNEWAWTHSFKSVTESYKIAASTLSM